MLLGRAHLINLIDIVILVAALVGLGWWVLRGDALNRAAEESPGTESPEHH